MTVLILSQHYDVFLHLAKNNPHITKVYLVNNSLADKLYYNLLFKKHKVDFDNLNYKRYTKTELQNVYNTVEAIYKTSIDYQRLDDKKNIQNIVLKYCNLFLNVKKFFEITKIDATVTWNGYFAPDRIVTHLAKETGVKTIHYEMGLFRPNTMTIDAKIVNYGNSVPQEIEYYKQNSFVPKEFNIQSSQLKSSSSILYKIYKAFDHFLYHIDCYTYKRFDNTKKIFNQKESTKTIRLEHIQNDFINIFVPLQVASDTQILLNSPDIKSMTELLTGLNKAIKELNQTVVKYKIYIKKHPKDLRTLGVELDKNIFVLDEKISSKDAIKATDMTLTINSTVGLEAVELNKPCVVLGNAFYSIEPIAFKANLHDLIDVIEKALINTDISLQTNFINYLKYYYQLPYNPSAIIEYDNGLHIKRFEELMG
jgi:capsule polysaccharide modification protein KpsS